MNKRRALTLKHTLTFTPSRPFNFDATVHNPDNFPSADNHWEPGVNWQTILWHSVPLGLKIENKGTVHKPKVLVKIWAARDLDRRLLSSLRDHISARYNFQMDLSEFNRRFRNDPQLGPAIRRCRGMRPGGISPLYQSIIVLIVLQNCTVRRSVNMLQALFENYGTLLSYNGKDLYCYWPPAVLDRASEQELRSLKLGYRAKNIKRITRAFTEGGFDDVEFWDKPREEQRKALLSLYGIGPASVGYMLGEFHTISPWEQKIYSKLFYDVSPERPVSVEKLMALFEKRFGQYKRLAVHYLWEDLFWKRTHEHIPWLEELIRL